MLFDTHSHIFSEELFPKIDQIITDAKQSGLGAICCIAVGEENLNQFKAFDFKKTENAFNIKLPFSSGLHPHEAKSFNEKIKEKIIELAASAACIGETGLDFYYDFSERQQQIDSFSFQVSLAKQLNKPLVIHCRESADEIHQVLSHHAPLHENTGILHCFTENWEWAKKFMDLGLKISFSGILSFKRAEELREVAKQIPLDRLLIETDSPYLAPVPYRGKTNQPAYLKHTFQALCAVRNEAPNTLEQHLWKNSCETFGLETQLSPSA